MRYKTHVIETNSRLVFEKAMASYGGNDAMNVNHAVFRQLTERDYGVDGQVELFDNDDMPTGRIAYIQLKGTAKPIEKLKRSEEVSCADISKSNIAYCQQRNVPVMLVYISVCDEDFYFIDLQSVYKSALNTIGDNASGTVRIPLINYSDNLDKFFEIINHYYDAPEKIVNTQADVNQICDEKRDWLENDGKNRAYVIGQYDTPSDGEHKMVNVTGEVLAQGAWKNDRIEKGVEYDYLIKVVSGSLIFKPDCPEDPYDASSNFSYEKLEQYGFDPLLPFNFSRMYVEHEGLEKYYVVDMELDGDMEQMTNIRTLEEFLKQKNPKLLRSIREMIELEKEEE